jgi:UDP-N-acetyl-D-mannosaminuronic acid dehydrogenase
MTEEKTRIGRREICFSSPWLELHALHPADGNGSPHYVVATKDYVSVLALAPGGNVLLVRQFRPAVGAVTLELPAGHVEPGQTPAAAAATELLEETGFRAASIEPLGCINPDTGRLANKHWCFVATGLEKVQADRAQGETAELVVVPLEKLGEMILDGRFSHAQHLAAIQLAMMKGKIELGSGKGGVAAQSVPRPAFVSTSPTVADVCVVGGAGHIGLPLSLVLARSGMRVMIYDTNEKALASIARGQVPFVEHGAQQLLDDALAKTRLIFTHDPAASRGVPNLIVTIGTPVDEFLNPDVGVIRRWVEGFLPHLSDDQLVMMRSTLYPGTTAWLDTLLRGLGRKPRIAFCPERIVQGQAIKELPTLPQIVSGTTPDAEEAAAEFWSLIAAEIVRLSPIEAEFAKLFCNAYRYIQFASANQLFMITTEAGVDFGRVARGLKEHYPRMRDFPTAGFAAGPCLLKDTMQLAAFAQNRFTLGHTAMQVNEGLVLWLVNALSQKHDLPSMTVGLLGMAFKADIDDTRTSLSYKLKKLLRFHCREVLTTDPFVTTDPDLMPTADVIARSDLLILCAPHTQWRGMDLGGKPLIDIWGTVSADPGLFSRRC